jgi:hypothetical protein
MKNLHRLLLLLALAAAVAVAWLAPLDADAGRHAEAGLKRALVTFATARALNAVISVAQGTEVSVQPAGVGVNFAPGQALDSINDLVEQFSTLMLVASVAFGVQLALLKFGAYWAVSVVLSVLALAWAAYSLRRDGGAPRWLDRALLVALLVRFAIPVAILGSEAGFQLFLEDDYRQGQARIEASTGELTALAVTPAPPKEAEGFLDRLKEMVPKPSDLTRRLQILTDAASRAVEHVVKLMVVFLLQTMVLPLLIIWLLARFGRLIFRSTD